MRDLLAFALGNVVAIAWATYAGNQSWIAATAEDPVPASLVGKWLPLAYVLAALSTAAVSAAIPGERRVGFLRRIFFIYVATPLCLLLIFLGRPVLNGQLGAVYMAMVGAFSVHALHGIWLGLPRGEPGLDRGRLAGPFAPRDRRIALLLGAAALAAYLMIVPYHRAVQPTASDEPHYLLIMQSLALDGDIELRNDYAGDRYLQFYPSKLEDIHGIHVGDAIYPIRDLGLPLLGAIPFALGGRLGVLVLVSLAGAALVYQTYRLLRELDIAPRTALLAVAATSFTHPILTYSSQVYPELLAALVTLTAARVLRRGTGADSRELAIAGALAGALPLLSTRAWFAAVGLGLLIVSAAVGPLSRSPSSTTASSSSRSTALGEAATTGRRAAGRAIAAGLPFIVIVGAISLANFLMFGLFLPSAGYYLIREQQQVLAYTPHVGALGLFFDRVFGLVGRAPIYLLAFVGLGALWARARSGHGFRIALVFLPWLLSFAYIANIAYWWADGSPPSRYLVATMPFLVVGVAMGIETITASRSRAAAALTVLAWLALAWSAFVSFAYAVQPNLGYDLAVDVRAQGHSGALFDYLGRVVRPEPGAFFPSLVLLDPASLALGLAWLLVVAALVLVGWELLRGKPATA